jgi:hypothetical protein
MYKITLTMVALAVVVGLGFVLFSASSGTGPEAPATSTPPVVSQGEPRLSAPRSGEVVRGPLRVLGEAPGGWFFEASFPVRLMDATGRELVAAPAQAQGDWMTPEYVPFEAILLFEAPLGTTSLPAKLILEKDNPSGLPENAAKVEIPLWLSAASTTAQ